MSNPTWTGVVEITRIFVETGERAPNGQMKRMPVKHRKIILTSSLGDELSFSVTKTSCGWSIRDPRGESGKTETVWRDGKPKMIMMSCDQGKSHTPTGWITEVTRLVGEDRAHALLVEATFGVKPSE